MGETPVVFVSTRTVRDGFSVILNEVKNPNGKGEGRIPMYRFFPASVGILRRFTPQNDTSGVMLAPRYKRVQFVATDALAVAPACFTSG